MISMAVPSGNDDWFADWPMYARASRLFHGNSWFSDVTLQAERDEDDEITWYG